MIEIDENDLAQLRLKKKVISEIKKEAKKLEPVKKESDLTEAIRLLAFKPLADPVNIEPVIGAMEQVYKTQELILQTINKPKPKKFEFNIIRNAGGTISKIIAKEVS